MPIKRSEKRRRFAARLGTVGLGGRVCGLCHQQHKPLMRTECCGQWICDDQDEYVMFSFARNSCSRNHERFTLCGFHFNEQHDGIWTDCQLCRESNDTEMYVWYGTNEYNFVKLKDPPAFEPTLCTVCQKVIRQGEDGYTRQAGKFYCMECRPEVLLPAR